MIRLLQSDLTKVTLFFILTILASAVISPWLYNAGMLLAEVGQSRDLNPILDWAANRCSGRAFATYYDHTLLISALALAGPFIMWCNLSEQSSRQPANPWRVKLAKSRSSSQCGQALYRDPKATLHFGIGLLIAVSLVTIPIVMIHMSGWLSFRHSVDYPNIIVKGLVSATIIAVICEWLFRGMLMGIFLRAMHPALAMVFISLLYAVICSLMPGGSEILTDPDKADAGFRMASMMIAELMTLEKFVFSFMLIFCFGLVLAYARYRTASLWLPIGLHLGFVFPYNMLSQITTLGPKSSQIPKILKGPDGSSGMLPFYLLIISALLVHIILQMLESKKTSANDTSSSSQ